MSESEQMRDNVFISYSHKDKKWLQRVETLLQPLISTGQLVLWDDSKIRTGQNWHEEIMNALETARVAVLLVSDHFLASEYIMKTELPVIREAAEKNRCTICWLLVRECLYKEAGIDTLQAAHDISRPLAGLKTAARNKTLAGIAGEIHRIYRETGETGGTAETAKITHDAARPRNQVKILSITASPIEVADIHYEMEQDIMLDSFHTFDRAEVYLDMPDPVQGTLEEIQRHLENGRHDILHITAHGSINPAGDGILCLEDRWGKLHEVTGNELRRVLDPAPQIVILSACHSASLVPEIMPVARALFQAGLAVVIGMKSAVSHEAAVEFNAAFFGAMCRDKTVTEAFAAGQAAILKGEQRRQAANPQRPVLKEYEVPQLLVRPGQENLTRQVFSATRIETPGRPRSHHFKGAKYLERGFIGRRQVLRDIFRAIEARQGAVVLQGPGGIGKSTITTRVAANLGSRGYEFIVGRGKTSPAQIFEALSKAAFGHQGALLEKTFIGTPRRGARTPTKTFVRQPQDEFDNLPQGEMEKLSWFLDNYLLKHKVAIIFDNFEDNQDEKAGDFRDPGLREFLRVFREALKPNDTFLFFSTRYSLPGYADPGVTHEIPEFTGVEFRKMLGNRSALGRLDGKSAAALRREIGGNPRALEILDQVAYNEYKQRDFTWEQLKGLIPGLRERLIDTQSKEDDFTPLFLGRLLGYLTEPQRRLLDIFSVFRKPVAAGAAAAFKVKMALPDRDRLAGLSLLECTDDDKDKLYYVHRLTAGYVFSKLRAGVQKKYQARAAGYLAGIRNEKGERYAEDLIEARWHFLQAREWDQAAEITFDLEYYYTLHGYPRFSMEMLREFDGIKLADQNRAILYHQMGILYQGFGDYEAALKQYQQSLEIAEKMEDTKGVAETLHQIGMIYQDKGDDEAALKHYQQSLEIAEKIGDTKGIAASLHQIGIIYQLKGDYEAALKHYQQSLEIREKIGDSKGIAASLHQIGMIYQYKGDYEAALKQYQQSLEIAEKMGNTKGVAESLHQIGMIYQDKGEYEAALKQYQQSLEIMEKIGDILGIAISIGQMGNLHLKKNDAETALKYFIQAFLVFAKIGSPYAQQAKTDIARCREKMTEERFKDILAEFGIETETPAPGEQAPNGGMG